MTGNVSLLLSPVISMILQLFCQNCRDRNLLCVSHLEKLEKKAAVRLSAYPFLICCSVWLSHWICKQERRTYDIPSVIHLANGFVHFLVCAFLKMLEIQMQTKPFVIINIKDTSSPPNCHPDCSWRRKSPGILLKQVQC